MTRLLLAAATTASLAIVGACHRDRISLVDASGTIRAAPGFMSPKLAYLPRVVAIPVDGIPAGTAATREGQALSIVQIASVDPVIALLRARDQIEIEDFVSAVQSSIIIPTPAKDSALAADSAKADSNRVKDSARVATPKGDSAKGNVGVPLKPPPPRPLNEPRTSPPPVPPLAQQWVHTLRVTPRGGPEMGDLAVDDGDYPEDSPPPIYGGRRIGRIPGWTLTLGTREFIRVLDVPERGVVREGNPGDVVVDFLWRWRPSRAGALFDEDGAEFQSLPKELQQAVLASNLTIDSSTPRWSRATLSRTSNGWRVALVDWEYGEGKPHAPW